MSETSEMNGSSDTSGDSGEARAEALGTGQMFDGIAARYDLLNRMMSLAAYDLAALGTVERIPGRMALERLLDWAAAGGVGGPG